MLEESNFGMTDSKYLVIWDNSSIHKSGLIKSLWQQKAISILTIKPYSPSLNVAEKTILELKTKVYKMVDDGR